MVYLNKIMKYTIKPCVEGDAEYIWERQKAEYSFSEACEDGAEELLVLKACDENGNTVGGCVLSIDLSGTAEFNSLFVDEGFRRRGIGSAIALEAERAARSRGCKMMINAYNFDFQFAKPLFEKLGYRCIGTAQDWPKGHASYTLIKKLGGAGEAYTIYPASVSYGNAEDGELITARLSEYNSAFAPRTHHYIDLDKKIVDESGNIIGGCIAGVSGWDALHIDLIWIDKLFLAQGFEAALIDEIEREARSIGAYISRTNVGEAQAKLFAALGYDIVVVYEGSPDWFVMQKRL